GLAQFAPDSSCYIQEPPPMLLETACATLFSPSQLGRTPGSVWHLYAFGPLLGAWPRTHGSAPSTIGNSNYGCCYRTHFIWGLAPIRKFAYWFCAQMAIIQETISTVTL